MAVTSTSFYPQSVNNAAVSITSALAGSPQTIVSAGTNGSRIDWVNLFTTDTSANTLTFNLYNGTTQYPLAVLTLPLGSGNTGTVPPVALFASSQFPSFTFDGNGNKFLYLQNGWSLTCTATAVTAVKTVTILAQYENF